jgi:acetyl esterase/lipase
MMRGGRNLYLGDQDPRAPLASPLYAGLYGLPPLLIQVESAEVQLDGATLWPSGPRPPVPTRFWPEVIHVWHSFAEILTEGRQAVARIVSLSPLTSAISGCRVVLRVDVALRVEDRARPRPLARPRRARPTY